MRPLNQNTLYNVTPKSGHPLQCDPLNQDTLYSVTPESAHPLQCDTPFLYFELRFYCFSSAPVGESIEDGQLL